MNKKSFILSMAAGIALINGAFASTPSKEVEAFDINTVEYIEDDEQIDLGFDVADYLPEGFNPYKMYVDLNAVEYIEEEPVIEDFSQYLPKGFDAYAYPTDVQSINYIDENDSFSIDFDTKKHLPEGFNAYIK
ncbi:hypothetical protein FEE95_21190 [Maribacter algarum]|uniref:Uncharacterized protein n=1 Tax=Maribacter algarum (ex Zhang et al. 2020) TaxID=2578118 RepID=A0A5S3PJC1_9FLAO|nr:hypothetical protein [Maribacter algarum]TMM52204.1 hypothetical protein FEE95_21190 [Maribacter algarum]